MRPYTRQEVEILLDTPHQRDFIVTAYADLRVQDGFNRYVDRFLRNEIREAEEALANTEARKALEANLDVVRHLVNENLNQSAQGLAIFASAARNMRRVMPLGFAVENQLVIDEEPYALPIVEHWFAEPIYLVAVVNSDRIHCFEAQGGIVAPIEQEQRADIDEPIERDKPRFTYQKRFAATHHERLRDATEDKFLKTAAQLIDEHWQGGGFGGIILLGQAQITSAVGRLLDRQVQPNVVEQAAQAMTSKPDEVSDDVARVVARWHAERDRGVLDELKSRWDQAFLVANGPTDVLDALQQGRASLVAVGQRRDLVGSRCNDCDYRFGAPTLRCVYCGGDCRQVNAVQEILGMALRHRVPVHLFQRNAKTDPLEPVGDVAALLVAEANWAPNRGLARATQGQ